MPVPDVVPEPLPVRLKVGVPLGLYASKLEAAGLTLCVPESVPDFVAVPVTLGVKDGVRVTV